MTVSTQVSRNEYTGNGVTTQYDFTFRILDKSHLLVQTLDAAENITTLTLGSDYSVTGVNRYPGGKVVLTTALPAGYKISIERKTPVTQETSIRNQGGFFPEIHEDAFDKLTMLVQQVYGWWSGLALKKPSWLANYYDAMNNRIRNLRDPSQAQDAATKGYTDSADSNLQQQINANQSRALRVPEAAVGMVPAVAGRKNKILAFNSGGDPIAVLPESGSAADVMIELASDEGASNVWYKKPYRNAVLRPISKMLSETISPFDFGIKSDAVFDPVTQRLIDGTDNTTAMQAMLCEAHYHGVEINFPLNGRFATKSLLLHYDAIKNPNWEGRPGRIKLTGSVTGHSTGDVETQGTAIYHIPGEASPLLSMIGEFSLTNPAGMGGYLSFGRINLIGSQDSNDVFLLQGSQGQIELESYTIKVLNPYGNGVTESTTWETTHRNVLIRGGASLEKPGVWKGIGLNIKSDGTLGQTNMKIYQNVDVYRMGTGIDIGRRDKPQGTFGPLVFLGGQTSLSDEYGMRLGGGVISFSSMGMQHEGARKNGLLIDRTLPDGSLESDLARSIRIQQNYFTGCGTIEDGTRDSYAIYVANGDGVHLDEPTLNTVGNGIGFDSGVVDNLKISRPTFRTVRDYGHEHGYGIRAFGEQNAAKRIELNNPIFNQNPLIPVDDIAKEIFGRASVGGRVSIATNNPTPSLSKGSSTGGDSFKQINFNNSASTVVTNILDGNIHQVLLVTFSNTNTTLQHGTSIILQGGKDIQGAANKVIQLYYNGSVWREIGDPVRSLTGTSANRPFSTAFPGMEYFDTTLNKPIWRNAANNGWVDAAGNVV